VQESIETYSAAIQEQYESDIGWEVRTLLEDLTAWAPLLGVPADSLTKAVPAALCPLNTTVSGADEKRTVARLAKRAVTRLLKDGALSRTIQEKAKGAALFTKNPSHLLAWDQFCLDWAPHQTALARQAVASADQLRAYFADVLPKLLTSLPPLPTASTSSVSSDLSPSGSPITPTQQKTRYILALDGRLPSRSGSLSP
jgi:hypothetical protein